jgi:zinc-ribbon domain
MPYNWKLASGHEIYVDNEGAQTIVTIQNNSAGQQQRSSNSFTTGIWIVPPEMTLTPTGAILKIVTPSGESVLQIHGNSVQMHSSHSANHSGGSQSTSSTSSSSTSGFSPMPPMQMGNMQMNMPPMVMKIGDMELNMGAGASQPRFCSQCGTAVRATDKFCASCGNKLG